MKNSYVNPAAAREPALRHLLRVSQARPGHMSSEQSGSNPEIRRKLTGHKTTSVNDLDTHFERETLKAAVHAIPSLPEL
jgi:hypothetical protein